jgi:hypothetical protein
MHNAEVVRKAYTDPNLLIFFADLEDKRDRKGVKNCRKRVSALQAKLGRELPSNVLSLDQGMSTEYRAFEEARRTAKAILAYHCRTCLRCKLGKAAQS